MKKHNKRFYLIDGIRGFAIINMILYHFLYDVFVLYIDRSDQFFQPITFVWQQFICWSFILISGMSWHFGKKDNLKRGLLLNFWGLVISFVTYFVSPQTVIWFGILNFIGSAVLLMIVLDKLFAKIPPVIGITISFILFLLFRNIQQGILGMTEYPLLTLPGWLYDCKILTPLGFPFPGFHSSDYFPLLPWFFLFCTGYFFWNIIKGKEIPQKILSFKIPVLSQIGVYSFWIYLLHQPVIILICTLLFGRL